MQKNVIKTVIFDFGGVYFTNGTKRAIRLISEKYNLSSKKVRSIYKGELSTKYRAGKLTAKEFWKLLKNQLNLNISSKVLSDTWLGEYRLVEDVSNIADKLVNANYELLYLSDNVQERVNYLDQKYNFLNKFKDGVLSYMAGTRKPDPKVYEMVLGKTSSLPQECVYIDDKPELLNPARDLGINVINFKTPEQLKQKLLELDLKF